MILNRKGAFISYARLDGEQFAVDLAERLRQAAPDLGTIWLDRTQMEGGIGWWNQITAAIDRSKFMILVMTPAAMSSTTAVKEWRYARQQGVCVYPVKAISGEYLNDDLLPRWMRKRHFFDLRAEWESFLAHLGGPCRVERVPFMAPDMPEPFIDRPREFGELLSYLLDETRRDPVAITSALYGAGGFGKTTLAAALCYHDDIGAAFDDGILWVTLGRQPNVKELLTRLYAALTDERPAFFDIEDAAVNLSQKLDGKNCLLCLDDVWDAAHLRPFLRGGKSCARLITTRKFDIAVAARAVSIDEMNSAQSLSLLTTELEAPVDDWLTLQKLTQRLGRWPLMIELARGALRERLARGDTVTGAMSYLNRALDRKGITVFDARIATERNQAIRNSIDISLELLGAEDRNNYFALAVFPEDTDIPLRIVADLTGLGAFETEEFAQYLQNLSLVTFNVSVGCIRLHDITRAYLLDKATDIESLHRRLLERWGNPYQLTDAYAWRWIAYHLVHGGMKATLSQLLFDVDWMQMKIAGADVVTLIGDYDYVAEDSDLRLIQAALRVSAHVLLGDPAQLLGQLAGRLTAARFGDIASLLERGDRRTVGPWLRSRTPSLMPPGAGLIRTFDLNGDSPTALAMTTDGARAVVGCWDGTLRVWDLESGALPCSLCGHGDWISAIALSSDGRRVISGSGDQTVRVWDLDAGAELTILRAHSERITAVAITADGRKVISASWDHRLSLWDLETGVEERAQRFESGVVTAIAVSSDNEGVFCAVLDGGVDYCRIIDGAVTQRIWNRPGYCRALRATHDGKWLFAAYADQILLWNLEKSSEERILAGHGGTVQSISLREDQLLISCSTDETVRVWDLRGGSETRILRGHTGAVVAVAATRDGSSVVSVAADQTLKEWDLKSGYGGRQHGHADVVTAIVMAPDDRYAVSASRDRTLKVWDCEKAVEALTLSGHAESVDTLALTPDRRHVISGSADDTIKVWDLRTGAEVRTLTGHQDGITTVALVGERYIVSGSKDQTIKLWELDTGALLTTLRGHLDVLQSIAVVGAGKYLISRSRDNVLKLWDLQTSTEVRSLLNQSLNVAAAAGYAGGQRLITVSDEYTLTVWDLPRDDSSLNWEFANAVVSQQGTPVLCAFSKDDIKTRELPSHAASFTLHGHSAPIVSISLTSGARRAVSASRDHSVRVWDLEARAQIARFDCDSALTACAASSDGANITVGDQLGAVHIFGLEHGNFA